MNNGITRLLAEAVLRNGTDGPWCIEVCTATGKHHMIGWSRHAQAPAVPPVEWLREPARGLQLITWKDQAVAEWYCAYASPQYGDRVELKVVSLAARANMLDGMQTVDADTLETLTHE